MIEFEFETSISVMIGVEDCSHTKLHTPELHLDATLFTLTVTYHNKLINYFRVFVISFKIIL